MSTVVKGLHRTITKLRKPFITASVVVFSLTGMFPAGLVAQAATPQSTQLDNAPKVESTPKIPAERVELTADRTPTQKTYRNPDYTLTTEISQGVIHYKDDQGKYQDIDTKLNDEGSELSALKTPAKPRLKKSLDNQGNVGTLRLADRDLRLRLKAQSGPVASPSPINLADLAVTIETSKVTYRGVAVDTDVRYQVTPEGLKEEIALFSAKAPTSFDFELELPNAKFTKAPTGELNFTDSATNKPLFQLPKPFMYDNANGQPHEREVSNAVSYEVTKSGNTFKIKVVADSAWIKAAGRKFPLVIDPTIVIDYANVGMIDTYTSAGQPTTNYGGTAYLLGGQYWSSTKRSFLKFNQPFLPENTTITEAKLRLWQYNVGDANAQVNIFRVSSNWNENSVTWNAMPTWSNTNAVGFVNGVNGNYVEPVVTNIVHDWWANGCICGFMLAYNNEAGAGRTWASREETNTSARPRLTITYTAPYSAQFVSQSSTPTVAAGEKFEYKLTYKNTGTSNWYSDGANPVRLGTWNATDHISPFHTPNDGRWLSNNRVKMDQQLVRPGDEGTFTITGTAPWTTGTVSEQWRALAEGSTSLEQPATVAVNVVANTFTLQHIGQSANPTLRPGDSTLAWIDIKNVGNTTWYQDSVRLAASNPNDRSSAFVTNGDWASASRATNGDKAELKPGETGRYSFALTAPSNYSPGTYNEYFNLVAEGVTWLNNVGMFIPITVAADAVNKDWGRVDNGTLHATETANLNGATSYTPQQFRKKINLTETPHGPVNLRLGVGWWDAVSDNNTFNTGINVYVKVNSGTPVNVTSLYSGLAEGTKRIATVALDGRDFVSGNNDVFLYATDPASGYREYIWLLEDTGGSTPAASHYTANSGTNWTAENNEYLLYLQGVENLGDTGYDANVGGVNVNTGNLVLSANDVNTVARGIPIKLDRTYNSMAPASEPTVLGQGWRFDFEQRLGIYTDYVKWVSEDGQRYLFRRNADGTYTRPPNTQAMLKKNVDNSYTIEQKKNLKVNFTDAGDLTSIVDKNGNTVTFQYTSGKLTTIKDHDNRNTTLTYNGSNKLEKITDLAGREVTYTYNGAGQLATATDATGAVSSFTYDATTGQLTQTTDARSNSTDYTYETSGTNRRVLTITDAEQRLLGSPKRTTFTYVALGETKVKDAKDKESTFYYDGWGRVTKTKVHDDPATTPANEETINTQYWDTNFNKLTTTATLESNTSQTHSEYDASGNVTRASDELGQATVTTYDTDYDNPLTVTDAKGVRQKYEYDTPGRLVKEWKDYTNKPAEFKTYTNNSDGTVASSTDEKNRTTSYGYDGYGRMTSTTEPSVAGSSGTRVTEYGYDTAGNKTIVRQPKFNGTTTQTNYEYDNNNRLKKVTDALSNVTETTYDGNGNKTSEKDAKLQVTSYEYDRLNQLKKTIAPDITKTTQYAYDEVGNVVSTTDAKGNVSTAAYDSKGQVTSESTVGVTTTATYNKSGDVTASTEASGTGGAITTTSTVDKAGQAKVESTTGIGVSANKYDANGNLIESANDTGITGVGLNASDQVTSENTSGLTASDQSTKLTYDESGAVSTITTPAGKTTTFTYDPSGNIASASVTIAAVGSGVLQNNTNIVDPLVKTGSPNGIAEAFSYEYDKNNNLTKSTRGNGDYALLTYDDADRQTSLTSKRQDNSVIGAYTFSYDPNSNVSQSVADSTTTNYTYDGMDQLLTAGDGASSWTYAYDNTGNRTSYTGPAGTTTYTYSSAPKANQLASSTKSGVTTTYTYDDRGNNTARSDGTTIAYNGDNQITSAKIGSGPTVSYSYDASKRLVRRAEGSNITRYHYDGDQVSAETDDNGKVITSYSYDPNGKLYSQTRKDIANPSGDNKVYYYHYNIRGDVTNITDPGGTIVKTYSYDPFGNIHSETNPTGYTLPNPYTYSTYWQDPTTKLYMLKARWYDPTLGRFLSVDPDPSNDNSQQDAVLNANLYLYTNNNPVARVDADGTGWKEFGHWANRHKGKIQAGFAIAGFAACVIGTGGVCLGVGLGLAAAGGVFAGAGVYANTGNRKLAVKAGLWAFGVDATLSLVGARLAGAAGTKHAPRYFGTVVRNAKPVTRHYRSVAHALTKKPVQARALRQGLAAGYAYAGSRMYDNRNRWKPPVFYKKLKVATVIRKRR